MKNSTSRNLKCLWVVVSFLVLITSRIFYDESQFGNLYSSEWIITWMGFLSFPTGLVIAAAGNWLVEASSGREVSLDSVIVWILLLIGGYIHWFWLLPEMFAKREIITIFGGASTAIPDDAAPENSRHPEQSAFCKYLLVRGAAALLAFLIGFGSVNLWRPSSKQKRREEKSISAVLSSTHFFQ